MSDADYDLVDLGFAEPAEAAWLTNRYFPSKIGGKPAWLELEQLPTKEQLHCAKCKQPKAFICQIYAPYEDDYNFHRSIFIFMCRTSECQLENNADNITVLRSQLGRKNDFYSEEPPKDDNDDEEALPAIPAKVKLCAACGCPGTAICGRCKSINYCSAAHQRAHWPMHKKFCGSAITITKTSDLEEQLPGILFPEREIVMESDTDVPSGGVDVNKSNEETEKDEDAQEKARLAEFEQLAASGKTGTLTEVSEKELDTYAASNDAVDDKYFRRFKKETLAEPSQVIRYKRDGKPLWITDVKNTVSKQLAALPKCENCGGERQFEFQIMPQMLLMLKDDIIDWGVLAVYSCAASCSISGYTTEFIIKQDIQIADEEE